MDLDTSRRLAFIDILRGIAVVWMIETHVVHVGLASVWKTGWLYDIIMTSNGFVAVGFVFCAGAGFWIAIERKWEAYRSWSPVLRQYLMRLGFILALAYWLNLPSISLDYILKTRPQSLLTIAGCDVLHAIVYSSLFSLCIVWMTRSLTAVRFVFLALALITFFITPWIWSKDPFALLPTFPGTLFSKPPISKFPLFPWAGYFFAGISLTGFFLQAKDQKKWAKILMLAAWILIEIVFLVKDMSFNYLGVSSPLDWGYSSPGHALFRLSGVVIIYAALFLVEHRFGAKDRVSRFFQDNGQESLFVYILHVMIIYGSVLNVGMNYFIPDSLSPLQVVLMTFVVTMVCYTTAMMWHAYKKSSPQQARLLLATMGFVFLSLFFLVPAEKFM